MHTTRTAAPAWRRAGALVAAIAVLMSTMLATAASADDVTDGELRWGFRESFRNYVGRQTAALPPIGALPPGERITLIGPAQWDTAGTPAWPDSPSSPNETLPYRLPVTSGTVTSASDLTIATNGGAAYHFPSHAFDVFVENVKVVVSGGQISVRGDLTVIIPENNLDFEPGTYGGTDVVIGTASGGGVDIDGDTVTVTGTGLTMSSTGADALQGFLPTGAELDNFTLTATVSGDGEPGEPGDPTFDPATYDDGTAAWGISTYLNANSPGRPNPSPANYGPPAAYDSTTKISTWADGSGSLAADGTATLAFEGSSLNHATTGGGWIRLADLQASLDASGNGTVSAVVSYGTASPPGVFDPEAAPIRGPQRINIVSLADNDAPPDQDEDSVTWTGLEGTWHDDLLDFVAGDPDAEPPIPAWLYASTIDDDHASGERGPSAFTFVLEGATGEPGGPGENEQEIEVTVPDIVPGSFSWTVDNSGGPVSLGTAVLDGDHLAATGAINPIHVTDTRAGGLTWSISAQVSDFASDDDTFDGAYLGWTPQVTTPGAGATAGASVASGFSGGDGLSVARVLASASAGHELGSTTLGAALDLRLPLDTTPGDYRAVLTVTALT